MKIGINASFVRKPGTGIGQVSLNFLRELGAVKTNHQFIIYLEKPLPKGFVLPKNFETRVFLPLWKRDDLIRKTWWEKRLLPKKIKKDECDVFFSLYQCPTILPKKIKHLMLVHDLIPKIFPEYINNSRKKKYQKLTEKGIQNANHILTVSKRTEKDLIQHLGLTGEKITVNHIDVDPAYKKSPSPKTIRKVLKKHNLKPGYILAGVGLDKRKNVSGLMRAYKKLIKENRKVKFLEKIPDLAIIGKPMPKLSPLITDIQKLSQELNLQKQVKILGFVPQKDMPTLYNQAHFFAFPSFYEGFGLPVLEAMNQKTPVLTSKTSSLPEVGRDAVVYCQPENTSEIAYVMKKILTNQELLQTLKKRGEERARNFSWEKFVQKFLNLV